MDPTPLVQVMGWPDFLSVLGFSLILFFVTLGLRRVVEHGWPSLLDNFWWSEVAVHALPVLLGIAGVLLMRTYPFPALILVNNWTRGVAGFVLGATCAWSYKLVRGLVKAYTGIDVGEDPPPALKKA